jgi:hypothetical protein
MILLQMFSGIKIQWQMIWHNKHQASDQIKENSAFLKNRMFRFLVDVGCAILLNQV